MTPMSEHRKFVHTFGKHRDLLVTANPGRAAVVDRVNHVMDGFLGDECGIARAGVMEDPKFEERLDAAFARIKELEALTPEQRAAPVVDEHQVEGMVSRAVFEGLRDQNKDLSKQAKDEKRKDTEKIAELRQRVNELEFGGSGKEMTRLEGEIAKLEDQLNGKDDLLVQHKKRIAGLIATEKRLYKENKELRNRIDMLDASDWRAVLVTPVSVEIYQSSYIGACSDLEELSEEAREDALLRAGDYAEATSHRHNNIEDESITSRKCDLGRCRERSRSACEKG